MSNVPLSLFIVERLRRDPSRDVREFVAFIQVSMAKLELSMIVPSAKNGLDANKHPAISNVNAGFATFSRPPYYRAALTNI